MTPDATTVFLTFPPRSIGDNEREILRQWFVETTDIAAAFACERRGDDPAYYRRIVIIEAGMRQPSYLVHCPDGTDVWLLTTLGEEHEVQMFPSLRTALQAVRPVPDKPTRPARPATGWIGDGQNRGLSGGPARTIAEMAAGLRRPDAEDSADATPRRKLP